MTVLAAALGVALTGCSHGDDTASPATTTTPKPPWDACSLPADLLQRAGVDPASKQKGLFGVDLPNSKTCRWTGKDYDIVLTASSTATTEQVRTREGNHSFEDVTVAGRPAFTVVQEAVDPDKSCMMVIPFQSGGLAYMQVARSGLTLDRTPACESAVKVGNVLASAMPR